MGNETLVMTATFRPAADTPGLIVSDEQQRLFQYLCALVSWTRVAHVRRIVFGENSNTTFDFSPAVRYAEEAGKEMEVLVFDGNREVTRYGKGYGEGEILEHVYRRSRLLQAAPAFYKVTGRLFVSNFDAISEATSTPDAFQRKEKQAKDGPPRPCKVVTTFYKCSLALFGRRLMRAYTQVDDRQGVFIEHVYYNELRGVGAPGFAVRPALVGQQASTGRVYGAYDDDAIATARSWLQNARIGAVLSSR
jgi:hypothetical protein